MSIPEVRYRGKQVEQPSVHERTLLSEKKSVQLIQKILIHLAMVMASPAENLTWKKRTLDKITKPFYLKKKE